MKVIRWILGKILLALNALTQPAPMARSAEAQAKVDAETAPWRLYQFEGCPFCIKTRRAMRRLNLEIAVVDVNRSPEAEAELIREGGKRKVPCLRMPNGDGAAQWMYESSDIIRFLAERFDAPAA